MRKISIILFFLLSTSALKAQDHYSNDAAKQILKEFYTAYFTALNQQLQPVAQGQKLDELRNKYCTKDLYKKLSRTAMNDDVLIGGDGYTTMEILNKTLIISKDPTSENDFVVSYMSHVPQVGKPTDLKVIIQLTVIKEGSDYRIAKVSPM
jgi:hypothetical protein